MISAWIISCIGGVCLGLSGDASAGAPCVSTGEVGIITLTDGTLGVVAREGQEQVLSLEGGAEIVLNDNEDPPAALVDCLRWEVVGRRVTHDGEFCIDVRRYCRIGSSFPTGVTLCMKRTYCTNPELTEIVYDSGIKPCVPVVQPDPAF